MRAGVVTAAILAAAVGGLVATPSALAKAKPCKPGTAAAKVGGHASCVAKRLVLPAPATTTAPALAQLRGALTLTQVGLKGRGGKRVAPLSQRVGRGWATARSRLLGAMSATLRRIARPLRAPSLAVAAADNCQVIDIVSQGGTFDIEGRPATFGGSYTTDGVSVSMGITSSGGMQLGMKTTVNGDTYTMKYDSGESDCTKHALPPCPQADGSLDAFGTKGKVGFSMTVTRGGAVLSKRSYAKTITVETKGSVADDAKLDYVDVRYGETTVLENDGLRYTSHATRLARIDMRSGRYDAGDSVSFGSATQAGDIANTAGIEADAGDFAMFVGKTIGEYRAREAAWQTPGTCARLAFDPASDTLTVQSGATGAFSARVLASSSGGGMAAKARWTLTGQQNGDFSPTSTNDREPSVSYTVASQPSGSTLSVGVRATSTAGVAQDTWSQRIEGLNTIAGTFTGHATDAGVIYDWTGTATFRRIDLGAPVSGPGGVFQLVSGDATVTVSGSENGSGCQQRGVSDIGLFAQSPWTVFGAAAPFSYDFTVPFLPDPPQAIDFNCSTPGEDGMPAGLGSMPTTALQSGSIAGGADPTGLERTTDDLYRYDGSASDTGPDADQAQNWTWSFAGSP